MKKNSLKILSVAFAFAANLMLAGCGLNKMPVASDPNIPANTVPPITQSSEQPSSAVPEEITDGAAVQQSTCDSTTEELQTQQTSAEEQVEDIPETKAIEYLKFLNSEKIHAKFLEIASIDGENMFSNLREYFVDGGTKIYINEDSKTIIQNGIATYIDYELGIYYSHPDAGDYSYGFGFDSSLYKLLSSSEEDGILNEEYSVEGYDLISTWTFENDGTVKVSDRFNTGSFTLYTFEIIDSNTDLMDFSIPEGFIEVDADDYMNY